MSEYIDRTLLRRPIYAEDDNATGFGMTKYEQNSYNEGIDVAWDRVLSAPTVNAVPLAEYEQLICERDAIIEYIKNYHECTECKWENALVTDEPCRSCKFGCGRDDRWEWRGMQEVQDDAKRKVD